MLTKEQILKADDRKTATVDVPEWDGEVIIRQMSGSERDSFEQAMFDSKELSIKANIKNIRAKLCALCIVDEDGERIFSDSEIDVLGAKSAIALDRVFTAAQTLNALTEADIEELAKN